MSINKGGAAAKWTEAEDALMREHYPAGMLAAQAVLPHRSRSGIHCRADKLGVSVDLERALGRRSRDSRLQQLAEHLRTVPSGATSAECAEALGLTHSRTTDLCTLARKVGLIASHPDPQGVRDRTLRHYAAEHAPKEPPQKPLPRAKERTAAPKLQGEARITPATRVTICPGFVDRRFEHSGPVPRVVDSAHCRDWLQAIA
jgi:hypothetical protein